MQKKYLYYIFGILAEIIAKFFLALKFYRIVKTRFKSHFGEIDIICISPDKYLCFVEVKKRSNHEDETLSQQKIHKIKTTAELFLLKNRKLAIMPMRFDYIVLNRFFIPKHHINYF